MEFNKNKINNKNKNNNNNNKINNNNTKINNSNNKENIKDDINFYNFLECFITIAVCMNSGDDFNWIDKVLFLLDKMFINGGDKSMNGKPFFLRNMILKHMKIFTYEYNIQIIIKKYKIINFIYNNFFIIIINNFF